MTDKRSGAETLMVAESRHAKNPGMQPDVLVLTNMSIDQIRKMSARIEKEKLRKKHLILLVRKMVMSIMMVRRTAPILT